MTYNLEEVLEGHELETDGGEDELEAGGLLGVGAVPAAHALEQRLLRRVERVAREDVTHRRPADRENSKRLYSLRQYNSGPSNEIFVGIEDGGMVTKVNKSSSY